MEEIRHSGLSQIDVQAEPIPNEQFLDVPYSDSDLPPSYRSAVGMQRQQLQPETLYSPSS